MTILHFYINCECHLGGDGKAIQTALGLLGAKCTQCTATDEEKNDPDFAKKHWFPKNRSKDQNEHLYQSLEKNPDGSIETKKASTRDRLGMSQPPMPAINAFLDWTEALPIMHGNIRCLYSWTRFAIFMKARRAFPLGIPIMNGKYPIKLKEKIKKALAKAKKWIQKKAKDGPLKMFLMTPDPTGAGTAFASIY